MYSLGKKLDSKNVELFGRKNHNVQNIMGKKLLHKKTVSKDRFKEDDVKKSDLEKM